MQPSWVGWVGFAVLAALVAVTSCQALAADDNALRPAEAIGVPR